MERHFLLLILAVTTQVVGCSALNYPTLEEVHTEGASSTSSTSSAPPAPVLLEINPRLSAEERPLEAEEEDSLAWYELTQLAREDRQNGRIDTCLLYTSPSPRDRG